MTDRIEIKHDIGYGFVGRAIMRNKELSTTSKAIYSYLSSFAGNTGQAYPSISLMCHELNISKNTFHKHKKELEDKGIIKIKQERENGKFDRNIYYILPCTNSWDTVNTDTEKMGSHKLDTNSNSINNNKDINNNIYIGEFKNVKLTKEEIERLEFILDKKKVFEMIDRLSIYMESSGKKYKSHFATLLNWIRKEIAAPTKSEKPKTKRFENIESMYD